MAVTGQKRLGPFLGWRSVEEFCAREQERFVTRTQTQDLHRPNGRDRKVSFGCASVLAPEGNTGNTRTEVLRGDGDRAFIGGARGREETEAEPVPIAAAPLAKPWASSVESRFYGRWTHSAHRRVHAGPSEAIAEGARGYPRHLDA